MLQNPKYIKAILDHSPESIVLIGLNHEILAFNKTMQAVLIQYFDKPIELGELYYPTYVIEPNKKLYLDAFNKAINGERVFAQNQTKNENISIWFEYKVLPVYDEAGKLFAISLTAKNIDKEKKAEEKIKKLNKSLERKVKERTGALEQSNRELDAFNHTISHDLRQPLNGIKNVLSSFFSNYNDVLSDKGRNDLQIVINALSGMDLLVRDLLNFSKLSKIELSLKKVNMAKLVKEVCNEVKLDNENSTSEIIVNDIPDAHCDPLLIKQVWANLISNAVKYSSKKEKPLIEIGSDIIYGKRAYIIKDNGIGFNMKYANKLFVIFERLDKKKEFDGAGIGLTTAHRIISRHGGRIWAEAKENRGATFYFTLTA